MDGACDTGEREACTGFRWGYLKDSDQLGDLDVVGKIVLRWFFRLWDVRVWTVSSWFRISTSCAHL